MLSSQRWGCRLISSLSGLVMAKGTKIGNEKIRNQRVMGVRGYGGRVVRERHHQPDKEKPRTSFGVNTRLKKDPLFKTSKWLLKLIRIFLPTTIHLILISVQFPRQQQFHTRFLSHTQVVAMPYLPGSLSRFSNRHSPTPSNHRQLNPHLLQRPGVVVRNPLVCDDFIDLLEAANFSEPSPAELGGVCKDDRLL